MLFPIFFLLFAMEKASLLVCTIWDGEGVLIIYACFYMGILFVYDISEVVLGGLPFCGCYLCVM